jgi:tetratricopeptide (TPR) repeat protein
MGDRALGVALRLKLGRVLVAEVNDVAGALDAYRAVYDVEDDNPEALAALERLYRQTSGFTDLLDIYGKRRDLTSDPAEKKAINYEIAKLYETEIKDVDRAIETYTTILEDEPSDARSLAALDVLYAELQRWQPFVDTLRRRIDLDVGEAELIDLKFRLGQSLEKHLGDRGGSTRELSRDPLSEHPA